MQLSGFQHVEVENKLDSHYPWLAEKVCYFWH